MQRINVILHSEQGQWWADSPDLDAFTAVASTLEDVRRLCQEGLEFYLDERDIEVVESIVFEDAFTGPFVSHHPTGSQWYVPHVSSLIAVALPRPSLTTPVRQLNAVAQ